MKSIVILLALSAGAIIFLAMFAIGLYNGLVRKRNRYQNAFAQIDVQLKRRYDLIPKLVNTAKAFLKHERETLEAVINARNQAVSARDKTANSLQSGKDSNEMLQLATAETALGGAIGKFFALSESYPELRSNENMRQLTEELATTENRLAFARQAYNDAVTNYNISRQTFPSKIFADMFSFQAAPLFEVESEVARKDVKVEFD